MPMADSGCFTPDWPLPSAVRAASTTRLGGFSRGAYGSFNLAEHVGDAPQAVAANRACLSQTLDLPAPPLWLAQRHGNAVAGVADPVDAPADARYVDLPGVVCAVLTADCLPLLLCSDDGREIAAVHCGWRGLAAGIVGRTVRRFTARPGAISAWLGPAIGPSVFEVGDEVRQAFLANAPDTAAYFAPGVDGRWLSDLFGLTRTALGAAHVSRVYGGGVCTFSDPERFYSYRRDGVCGRMASLIWRVA